MVRNVTLTIDRKSVTVPENTTILEAARSVNINIPTLALERQPEVRNVPKRTEDWPAECDRRVDPKGAR